MSKLKAPLAIFIVLFLFLSWASADELSSGRELLSEGNPEAAADFFCKYAKSHPKDKERAAESLALCGRTLDSLQDSLTGAAEKACYWTKGGSRTPECMHAFAEKYNSRFGPNAFQYEHGITYIRYTGSHYKELMEKYPKTSFTAEADFYLTLHNMIGLPDVVLPRIKSFLAHHPRGEWHRRGLLLWARVNEDIWYVHRKWSWMLYNTQLSPEELIIRAEPFRQEALRTFREVMKEKRTFEGMVAAREYGILNANEEELSVYAITNDSIPGTLQIWGIGENIALPGILPPESKGGEEDSKKPRKRSK